MSMKQLLGLEEIEVSDEEIVEKIREAQVQNKTKVIFVRKDGGKVEISLQPIEYFECGILD